MKRLNYAEDFIIVLDINKGLFNFDKNIIYITAYIPPPSSKYSNVEMFNSLANVILNYDTDEYFHLLSGDFNAHTKKSSDLVTFENEIIELLDLDEDTRTRLDIIKNMDLLGLPTERYSRDLNEDAYGKALLELCKNHMLCIFNGRTGADRNIGNLTTKGKSLIDYVIGSPYLLSKVKIFKVNPFDPLFSDYHCLIEWKINSNKTVVRRKGKNIAKRTKNHQSPRFWDPNKAASFLQNLDRDKISHMIEHFDTYTTNQITNELKQIMLNSAKLSFSKFRPKLNIKNYQAILNSPIINVKNTTKQKPYIINGAPKTVMTISLQKVKLREKR